LDESAQKRKRGLNEVGGVRKVVLEHKERIRPPPARSPCRKRGSIQRNVVGGGIEAPTHRGGMVLGPGGRG